jgi:hypothetical protein
MCSVDKVIQLFNHSVMKLFDTRMNSTSTEMVPHHIQIRSLVSGLNGELQHLKTKTRLIDEMFPSVMGDDEGTPDFCFQGDRELRVAEVE